MKILLGVTGGIAAYKAAELARELQRRGADVQVAMTSAAERFITPLTFASLTGRQVLTSLWSPTSSEATSTPPQPFDIEHIATAQQIDLLLIAPATANTLAKLAHGLADDLLTTIALATKAPLLIAPAMNVNMWHHPATQENLETLRSRRVHIVEPGSGDLACGMVGEGRLAEPTHIADAAIAILARSHDLLGETVLITAGGTHEPVDAVRYFGNHSSGKMGHALAAAALARGAHVILITASTSAPVPTGCEPIHVTTAAEMQSAALTHLPRATILIMAAAVSDYRLKQPAAEKLKKQPTLTLELIQNPDILSELVARRRPGAVIIGFAAETSNLVEEARRKLQSKGLDAIVANDVSDPASGFHVDRNAGYLLTPTGEIELPSSTKRIMADRILDQLPTIRASATAKLAMGM